MTKKTLTDERMAELRAKGIVTATDDEIAQKRAERAERKRKKIEEIELLKKKEEDEAKILKWFPDFETTKNELRNLTAEIRDRRHQAVKENIDKGTFKLPEDVRERIKRAFMYLPYLDSQIKPKAKGGLSKNYQIELGDLAIECLKIQDREVKKATFKYMNVIFTIVIDWPFLMRMLNKYYVSGYGWRLMRVHAHNMPDYAGDLLGAEFDKWAKNPKTQEQWRKLAKEDGMPIDIREIIPRR